MDKHAAGDKLSETMIEKEKRNMKGFIFTTDSLFALIVTAAAISVLLFSVYTPSFSYQSPASEAASLAQNLLQTTVGQAALGNIYAKYAAAGWSSGQWAWPQYGRNASLSSATPGAGPALPLILFAYQAGSRFGPLTGSINPNIAVGDGLVVYTTTYVSSSGTPPVFSGSYMVALNATNGKLVFDTNAIGGGYFSGDPVIYNHNIYALNNTGAIYAFTENGYQIWNTVVTGMGGNNVVLSAESGYLVANAVLINPSNGLVVSSSIGQPTLYNNGEFISAGPTGAGGTTFSASGNALYGKTLNLIWGLPLTKSSGATAMPASAGNMFVIAGGLTLFANTLDGKSLWSNTLLKTVHGGAAIYNTTAYVQSANAIAAFGINGNTLFRNFEANNPYNFTPTATRSLLYQFNGVQLYGISTTTGNVVWNFTAPLLTTGTLNDESFGDIPVAYGNLYYGVGNVLIALSTCRADPRASLLQALATYYLNNQSECANLMLNKTYPSNNVAIYINNTYAPSLKVATFNGLAGNFIEVANQSSLNSVNALTVAVWINTQMTNPGSNWAHIVSTNGNGNTGASEFALRWSASNVEFSVGLAPSGAGNNLNISQNKVNDGNWHQLVGTANGVGMALYLDGSLQANGIIQGPYASIASFLSFGGGGTVKYNGNIAGVQIYNTTLNTSQVGALYAQGISATPIVSANIVGWWPLEGDTNDYAHFKDGLQIGNITFAKVPFTPPSLRNSYSVSKASVPLILNASGTYGTYNVGVVIWR